MRSRTTVSPSTEPSTRSVLALNEPLHLPFWPTLISRMAAMLPSKLPSMRTLPARMLARHLAPRAMCSSPAAEMLPSNWPEILAVAPEDLNDPDLLDFLFLLDMGWDPDQRG